VPVWPAGLLETEARRFTEIFPQLSVRFAEVLGRRISHLAGSCIPAASGDLRLDLAPGLVAMVSGPWRDMEDELRGWSEAAGGRIGGKPRRMT
jgi:hypothetical protein